MKKYKLFLKESKFLEPFLNIKQFISWVYSRYIPPSPQFIKDAVISRNGIPDATWVETGTYLGHTTNLLAKSSVFVYSIEASEYIYKLAKKRFIKNSNVKILHGSSENIFPDLIPAISGDVSFWLDAHYSGGLTFQGEEDTPIILELSIISKNINNFNKLCVMIDDIRCFCNGDKNYPTLDFLVDWSRENKLIWHIEQDIFIARKL